MTCHERTTGSARALCRASARIADRRFARAERALASRFRGNTTASSSSVSTFRGLLVTHQVTSALSAIHCDSAVSPAPKVGRRPLPTRRSSIPNSAASKHTQASAATSNLRRCPSGGTESAAAGSAGCLAFPARCLRRAGSAPDELRSLLAVFHPARDGETTCTLPSEVARPQRWRAPRPASKGVTAPAECSRGRSVRPTASRLPLSVGPNCLSDTSRAFPRAIDRSLAGSAQTPERHRAP